MLDRGPATELAPEPSDAQLGAELAGNEVYTAEQWQLAGTMLPPAIAGGPADVAALLRRFPGGSSMQAALVVWLQRQPHLGNAYVQRVLALPRDRAGDHNGADQAQHAEHDAPAPRVAEVAHGAETRKPNAALKVVVYDQVGAVVSVWTSKGIWDGALPRHYHGARVADGWTWDDTLSRTVRVNTRADGTGGVSVEAWAAQHHGARVEIFADPIDAVTARHDGAEPDAHAPGHAARSRDAGDGSTEQLGKGARGPSSGETSAATTGSPGGVPGQLGDPDHAGGGAELEGIAVSDPEGEQLADEFERALGTDHAERGDDEDHARPGAGYTGGDPAGRTGADTSTRRTGPGGANARDGGQNEVPETTRRDGTGAGPARGRFGGEGGPDSAGVRGAGALMGGVIAVPEVIKSVVEIALLIDAGDITGAGGSLFRSGVGRGRELAAARQLVAREARTAALREIQQVVHRPEWERAVAGLGKAERHQALRAVYWELQRKFFRGYLTAARAEQRAIRAAIAQASPAELAGLEARRATAHAGEQLATVEPVAGRLPLNHELAAKEFPRELLPAPYREAGLRFKATGYPDFEPYALELPTGRKTVRIELTGSMRKDVAAANKAAGLRQTPKGYIWHHVEDGATMMLVPEDLHEAVRHTGGRAMAKHRTGVDYGP